MDGGNCAPEGLITFVVVWLCNLVFMDLDVLFKTYVLFLEQTWIVAYFLAKLNTSIFMLFVAKCSELCTLVCHVHLPLCIFFVMYIRK